MMLSKRIKTLRARGFSVVELLVASALFSIVVAVVAGSFISILNASHQARSLGRLMLEVDFALEDMSRNIRTGNNFTSPPENGSGGTLLFRDQSGRVVRYDFDSADNTILKSIREGNTYLYQGLALTSPAVRVLRLNFARTPPRAAGIDQPRIIIQIVGELRGVPNSQFFLQTSVTQRELNL